MTRKKAPIKRGPEHREQTCELKIAPELRQSWIASLGKVLLDEQVEP